MIETSDRKKSEYLQIGIEYYYCLVQFHNILLSLSFKIPLSRIIFLLVPGSSSILYSFWIKNKLLLNRNIQHFSGAKE